MKIRKKTKHFRKKAKPIPVETHDLPNNVRVGYKDIKIRYVRPNYKKWELTDCFGECYTSTTRFMWPGNG